MFKICNVKFLIYQRHDNIFTRVSIPNIFFISVWFSFGMYHDTEKIGCSKREGDTLHVMTPSFEVDAVGVAWSRCSRRDITNFLE